MIDKFDGDYEDEYDRELSDRLNDPDYCDRCNGDGRVTTMDYESYFGAMFKPCPKCQRNPCSDQPPTS